MTRYIRLQPYFSRGGYKVNLAMTFGEKKSRFAVYNSAYVSSVRAEAKTRLARCNSGLFAICIAYNKTKSLQLAAFPRTLVPRRFVEVKFSRVDFTAATLTLDPRRSTLLFPCPTFPT